MSIIKLPIRITTPPIKLSSTLHFSLIKLLIFVEISFSISKIVFSSIFFDEIKFAFISPFLIETGKSLVSFFEDSLNVLDRLAFSVLFKITTDGEVLDYKIKKTVIHSNYRFTYENAEKSLNKKNAVFHNEILLLNRIAKKLRAHIKN